MHTNEVPSASCTLPKSLRSLVQPQLYGVLQMLHPHAPMRTRAHTHARACVHSMHARRLAYMQEMGGLSCLTVFAPTSCSPTSRTVSSSPTCPKPRHLHPQLLTMPQQTPSSSGSRRPPGVQLAGTSWNACKQEQAVFFSECATVFGSMSPQ